MVAEDAEMIGLGELFPDAANQTDNQEEREERDERAETEGEEQQQPIQSQASTVSLGQFLANKVQRDEIRRFELDDRESRLNQREMLGQTPNRLLENKIYLFLLDGKPNDIPYIDSEVAGYAMAQHDYFRMSKEERNRLNKLRTKIELVQAKIDNTMLQEFRTESCCPVCFDSLASSDNDFYRIRCGHVYCGLCLAGVTFHNDNRPDGPICSLCKAPFSYEEKERIYFGTR